jgi:hypothetical protein
MRPDEALSRSVALRTFDGRSHLKTDVASEAAGLTGKIATAVVRQPFDGDRQTIDHAEYEMPTGGLGRLNAVLECYALSAVCKTSKFRK